MPESAAQPGSDSLHEVARAALLEITSADTIGAPAGQTVEADGVVSVLFECTLPGYPGWKWTVSVATLEGEQPSVLEAELMPADGALLSPEWVPWSDRLADYKAAQIAAGEAPGDEVDSDDDDDDSDDEADDDSDDDETDDASDDDSDDDDDDDDSDDDDDDDDEDDDEDDDDLGSDILHSGDVDGVDIDEIAVDDESDDSDDDSGDGSGDDSDDER